MTETARVVGICGSLRDDSRTRVALERLLEAGSESGADTGLLDLRDYHLPVFDADHGDAGDAPALRQTVADADVVVLATPVYHGSYATPLKNALDYCGRDEFDGTTIGLLAVAGGGFPRPALAHLREVSRALDAWVHPDQVSVPNSSTTVDTDRVVDDALADRIDRYAAALVDYAHLDQHPELAADRAERAASVADD